MMTVASLVVASGMVTAACPYPLGQFAAEGHIQTWNWTGNVSNVETEIIEATLIHGQKAFGQIVNVAGDLKFVYNAEVEWELPNGEGEAETHSIFLREYSNATGWDVPIQFLASDNVSEERPVGRNVQPSATAFGNDLWTVWETSGRIRENGSYVIGRSFGPSGFGPITNISFVGADSSNKLPKILTYGDAMYIIYETNAASTNVQEYVVVGRTFDGTTLGPIEQISSSEDGWSDQVPWIATDGTRIFAAWATQNTTRIAGEGDWVVQAAARNPGGHWSDPFNLTNVTGSGIKTPATEFYAGKAYVTWASNDPAYDGRGDYDIYMRGYDANNFQLTGTWEVTGNAFQQEEVNPVLYSWPTAAGGDGRLHILWSSTSSPPGVATSGPDNDMYYRSFDGTAFSNVLLVSDPLDTGFFDVLPGFFTIDGALFAYYLSNICIPDCGHETDWREMTRLLSRPARSYDDVTATYVLPAGNNTTSLLVNFTHEDGSPATGDGYMVKLPNGTIFLVTLTHGQATVPIQYNGSLGRQLTATYCGAPVATIEVQLPGPPTGGGTPANNNGVVIGLAAVLAAVAVLGVALWMRKRSSGGGTPPREQ